MDIVVLRVVTDPEAAAEKNVWRHTQRGRNEPRKLFDCLLVSCASGFNFFRVDAANSFPNI